MNNQFSNQQPITEPKTPHALSNKQPRVNKEYANINIVCGIIFENFYVIKNSIGAVFFVEKNNTSNPGLVFLFSDGYVIKKIKAVCFSSCFVVSDKTINHALDTIYVQDWNAFYGENFHTFSPYLWSTPNLINVKHYYRKTICYNKIISKYYPAYEELIGFLSSIGVPSNKHLILLTWLVSSIRLDNEFMMLELVGKNTTSIMQLCETIKRTIGADSEMVQVAPKTIYNLHDVALEHHLVNIKTTSKLSDDLQQEMVTMLTNGSRVSLPNKKSRFSGDFYIRRPIISSSEKSKVTLSDLKNMTITINVNKSKERVYFNLDSVVYNIASNIIPSISYYFSDKRVVFYRLGLSVCSVIGLDDEVFKKQFNQLEEDKRLAMLLDNPVGMAILNWAKQHLGSSEVKTVLEWRNVLCDYQDDDAYDEFPATPKKVGQMMNDATPILEEYGIVVTNDGVKINGKYHRKITVPAQLIAPNPAQAMDDLLLLSSLNNYSVV